ncbi:hypothetical protein EMCRGX_G003648 [Ephydatia muelleri]
MDPNKLVDSPNTDHKTGVLRIGCNANTYILGGIIWFRFTLTKSTITGIGGKEACVSSMSTEGSAAMLIAMTLVLQKLVSSLDAEEECAEILLQAWYLGNGALAGTRSAVLRALHLIEVLHWAYM